MANELGYHPNINHCWLVVSHEKKYMLFHQIPSIIIFPHYIHCHYIPIIYSTYMYQLYSHSIPSIETKSWNSPSNSWCYLPSHIPFSSNKSYRNHHLGGSWNGVPHLSSTFIDGFSILNQPTWGSPNGNPHFQRTPRAPNSSPPRHETRQTHARRPTLGQRRRMDETDRVLHQKWVIPTFKWDPKWDHLPSGKLT